MVECKPVEICECGGKVQLHEKAKRHQIYEIPEPKFEITEYRLYKDCCENCSRQYRGELPKGISQKGFGPRLHALLGLLTSKYRMSKRQTQDWFKDVYGMPISLGSVSNIEHTISQSLVPAQQAIWMAVQEAKVVHVDETGHKEKSKSAWAWISSTAQYTCFMLRQSRGRKIAKEVAGILNAFSVL